MNNTEEQKVKGYRGKIDGINLEKYCENGKYGLKDQKGVVIIPADYDEIEHATYYRRGWNIRKGDTWGSVNERGEWLFPVDYEKIMARVQSGHYLKSNGKWGFCNSEGKMTIDCVYDEFSNYIDEFEMIEARCGKKWGTVNEEGKVHDLEGKEIEFLVIA